jgi:hypothetical protein
MMCVFSSLEISVSHFTAVTFNKLQASFWASQTSTFVIAAVLIIKSGLIL